MNYFRWILQCHIFLVCVSNLTIYLSIHPFVFHSVYLFVYVPPPQSTRMFFHWAAAITCRVGNFDSAALARFHLHYAFLTSFHLHLCDDDSRRPFRRKLAAPLNGLFSSFIQSFAGRVPKHGSSSKSCFWYRPCSGLCLDSGVREQEWNHDRPCRHSFRLCKRTLRKAPVEARKEAEKTDEEEHVPDQDDHGQKCERLPCRKAWPPYTITSQHVFSDVTYLPAIGMQMAQDRHRAIGLYDEGCFLLRARGSFWLQSMLQ